MNHLELRSRVEASASPSIYTAKAILQREFLGANLSERLRLELIDRIINQECD